MLLAETKFRFYQESDLKSVIKHLNIAVIRIITTLHASLKDILFKKVIKLYTAYKDLNAIFNKKMISIFSGLRVYEEIRTFV